MRDFRKEDFAGGGQYLVRLTNEELKANEQGTKYQGVVNTGYLSTIMEKVGYIHGNPDVYNGGQLITLTAMSDGWTRFMDFGPDVDKSDNKIQLDKRRKNIWQTEGDSSGTQKLCNFLNAPYSQEVRFATQEEVIRVVAYQKHRWREN